MSFETKTSQTNPQEQKNHDFLRGLEMGGMLDHDYTMALSFAPRLSEVDILPIPEDNKTSVAHARPAWETESGRHTIFINTNHADALQRCKKVVDTIPGAREIFAGQLQMRPEDITPEQLLRLAVLQKWDMP